MTLDEKLYFGLIEDDFQLERIRGQFNSRPYDSNIRLSLPAVSYFKKLNLPSDSFIGIPPDKVDSAIMNASNLTKQEISKCTESNLEDILDRIFVDSTPEELLQLSLQIGPSHKKEYEQAAFIHKELEEGFAAIETKDYNQIKQSLINTFSSQEELLRNFIVYYLSGPGTETQLLGLYSGILQMKHSQFISHFLIGNNHGKHDKQEINLDKAKLMAYVKDGLDHVDPNEKPEKYHLLATSYARAVSKKKKD